MSAVAKWMGANDWSRGAADDFAHGPVALVVDLDDPALADEVRHPATALDIADMAKPIAGRRDYFLKRRSLVRALVGRRFGSAAADVTIAHDRHGAPRALAPAASIFVSVAARGSVAALAIDASPIGVDIELIEPPREPVWQVLHPDERADVERDWRAGDDSSFRDLWIAKEAYVKSLGSGLVRDPSGIAIRRPGVDEFQIVADPGAGRGQFATRVVSGARVRCALMFARRAD